MDHIVYICQPFVKNQTIMVYQNGECVETIQCEIYEVSNQIDALVKKNKIKRVDIKGSLDFMEKLKEELISTKFNNKDLEVFLHT